MPVSITLDEPRTFSHKGASRNFKRRAKAHAHAVVLDNLRRDRRAELQARLRFPPLTRKTRTKAGRNTFTPPSALKIAAKRARSGRGRRV